MCCSLVSDHPIIVPCVYATSTTGRYTYPQVSTSHNRMGAPQHYHHTVYVAGPGCVCHTLAHRAPRPHKSVCVKHSARPSSALRVPSHHVRFCKSDKVRVGSLPVSAIMITGMIPTPRWHTLALRLLTQPSAKTFAARISQMMANIILSERLLVTTTNNQTPSETNGSNFT